MTDIGASYWLSQLGDTMQCSWSGSMVSFFHVVMCCLLFWQNWRFSGLRWRY